jgi:malonyl-CoA/methylmalonyl-CoA synthetase
MSKSADTSKVTLVARAEDFPERTAIIAPEGAYTYGELLRSSHMAASRLLGAAPDLREARVAFLVPPGFQYVATQWGIWRAGGIAVPLCVTHPAPELEYTVSDSGAEILVAHPVFEDVLRTIAEARGTDFLLTSKLLDGVESALPEVDAGRRAMVLYTSGTTSRPKGVVITHANIDAQVTSLVSAWGWTSEDHILNVLPLHHVHGVTNALACALWVGATCEILPGFDPQQVWSRLGDGDPTLFMGVPTTYARLIEAWETAPPGQRRAMSDGCGGFRLMVCGSDALPVSTLERWREISGHVLLERYGMTEIGMALSNPLEGERMPGYVGTPLPGVEVRLAPLEDSEDSEQPGSGGLVEPGTSGELQIRGPGVFQEYWGRPEVTKESFTNDGWFRTGDVASVEHGAYRIWGRASTDIIKTGGEKVSANEVQRELLSHPDIKECAVVGVRDPRWGEAVAVALVLREGGAITRESLREWGKKRLADYKVPQHVLVVDGLPRNAMGKVIKPEVLRLFEDGDGVSTRAPC